VWFVFYVSPPSPPPIHPGRFDAAARGSSHIALGVVTVAAEAPHPRVARAIDADGELAAVGRRPSVGWVRVGLGTVPLPYPTLPYPSWRV
jgi:hypothetical protein